MIQRVRDNNQGQIVTSNPASSLQNPFAPTSNINIDEEEANFIPFDHT